MPGLAKEAPTGAIETVALPVSIRFGSKFLRITDASPRRGEDPHRRGE
jgi:hypothetical protein